MKDIQRLNFNSEAELVDFASYTDPASFKLFIEMYSMDREANEVFNEEEGSNFNTFAGSLEIIEDVVYFINFNNEEDFYAFYEQNVEVSVRADQESIKNWFADCWRKAGGKDFTLPVYFSFHDESESRNEKKNKWISEEEMWSY